MTWKRVTITQRTNGWNACEKCTNNPNDKCRSNPNQTMSTPKCSSNPTQTCLGNRTPTCPGNPPQMFGIQLQNAQAIQLRDGRAIELQMSGQSNSKLSGPPNSIMCGQANSKISKRSNYKIIRRNVRAMQLPNVQTFHVKIEQALFAEHARVWIINSPNPINNSFNHKIKKHGYKHCLDNGLGTPRDRSKHLHLCNPTTDEGSATKGCKTSPNQPDDDDGCNTQTQINSSATWSGPQDLPRE